MSIELIDPIKLSENVRRVVCICRSKGGLEERKYYRFRGGRWYGGIATADCVGCNLRCIFCWSWRPRDNMYSYGKFYGPAEVSKRLISIARSRGYRLLRLSGGEPTICRQHLLQVLDSLSHENYTFILETNGILIGYDKKYAKDLSKYPNLHVRVSIKGTSPEEFSKLLNKRGLYKFSKLEPTSIPKETAIRRLLESYGFQAPSQWGFEIRSIIKDYIYDLREFKKKYHQLRERDLVNNIISFLKNGRDHLERIVKEFAYILIILILNLKYVAEQNIEISFLIEWPLAMPRSYSRYRDLYNLKREVFNLLRTLLDPSVFGKLNQHRLTLGDWQKLIKCLLNYLERDLKFFYKELMIDAKMRLEKFKYLISQVEKEGISAQLNKASHEEGRREIMIDADSRKNAIEALLKFDIILAGLYSCLPPLARITREVKEIETGLQYYETKIIDENFKEKTLKIYGTPSIEPSETYYIFTRKDEEDKIAIYPMLVTNLSDVIL